MSFVYHHHLQKPQAGQAEADAQPKHDYIAHDHKLIKTTSQQVQIYVTRMEMSTKCSQHVPQSDFKLLKS